VHAQDQIWYRSVDLIILVAVEKCAVLMDAIWLVLIQSSVQKLKCGCLERSQSDQSEKQDHQDLQDLQDLLERSDHSDQQESKEKTEFQDQLDLPDLQDLKDFQAQ